MHERLAASADQWFARARAASLDTLPCRAGCSHCCIGPFPITILDRDRLQEGLAARPEARRREMAHRARRQVEAMERDYPRLKDSPILDHWADQEIDRLVTDFHELPCPALEADGTCGIYDARPLTCRLMGIPTEEAGVVQGACHVQTAVPIIRLPDILRRHEDRLIEEEAALLQVYRRRRSHRNHRQRHAHHQQSRLQGDELLLPYGFLPEPTPDSP